MLIDTYLISVLCPQLLTFFLPANIVDNSLKMITGKKQTNPNSNTQQETFKQNTGRTMQWHYGGSNSKDFLQKGGKKVQLVVIKYWFVSLPTVRKKLCSFTAVPFSSLHACRWNLCGHIHTPSCGSSAGHSRRQRERGLFSLQLPRGSEFQAAVGPRPAAPTVWRRPEGQRRGSLWHRIICRSVIVPAGRDAQDCVACLCVHMKYIYAGFRSEHIFVSQGLIFICCVSTRWRRSAEKLTQEILARPFKETGPKRSLWLFILVTQAVADKKKKECFISPIVTCLTFKAKSSHQYHMISFFFFFQVKMWP